MRSDVLYPIYTVSVESSKFAILPYATVDNVQTMYKTNLSGILIGTSFMYVIVNKNLPVQITSIRRDGIQRWQGYTIKNATGATSCIIIVSPNLPRSCNPSVQMCRKFFPGEYDPVDEDCILAKEGPHIALLLQNEEILAIRKGRSGFVGFNADATGRDTVYLSLINGNLEVLRH